MKNAEPKSISKYTAKKIYEAGQTGVPFEEVWSSIRPQDVKCGLCGRTFHWKKNIYICESCKQY